MAFLFLIDVIKGLLIFTAICMGLGIAWVAFVVFREVGWLIKQENRKQYKENKENGGKQI